MAAKHSAGLVPWRRRGGALEVFLVHPGGPFWAKRDLGAWSIAKGGVEDGEEPLAAARREFLEETSLRLEGTPVPLGSVQQKGGKLVEAWAVEADFDGATIRSTEFELEWPPRSGRRERFPEVDRAAWFDLATARVKILAGQRELLERLAPRLASG